MDGDNSALDTSEQGGDDVLDQQSYANPGAMPQQAAPPAPATAPTAASQPPGGTPAPQNAPAPASAPQSAAAQPKISGRAMFLGNLLKTVMSGVQNAVTGAQGNPNNAFDRGYAANSPQAQQQQQAKQQQQQAAGKERPRLRLGFEGRFHLNPPAAKFAARIFAAVVRRVR